MKCSGRKDEESQAWKQARQRRHRTNGLAGI